ncbi:malonyl-CoA decarboxylase domain-containing protein [Pseudotabrizicola sp. L79]|uniref:malonyl-CoA decarboxylase domain-containing protein n=1 Tax=Pseudotabrizicola sp. L79 TaxID=3118402 RepID=UPI002F95BC57
MPKDASFSKLVMGLIGPGLLPRLWGQKLNAAQNDPIKLSHMLLTTRGEVSGTAIADHILTLLEGLSNAKLLAFFAALRDDFEVDQEAVQAALDRVKINDPKGLQALQMAAEPPRQELFRRLNAAPGGTGRLVALRCKLLKALRDDPSLSPIDFDLRHLLRSWFNRGFLMPARIDWNTPAAILEKIIAYEAVHAIDTWDELRTRLAPQDRRCFAFFHPAMPNEPLIFVEVALTQGVTGNIQEILKPARSALAAEAADTAIFYSISNCQAGLAGVSFGAFLIKQVAADLKAELPGLKTFCTLSPVPGLARWAKSQGYLPEGKRPAPETLSSLAADYLVNAKDSAGRPLDPVARFHLGNGAELHRINLDADSSAKGETQSLGVMVNYLYDLDTVEARHEAFAASGTLAVARAIRSQSARAKPHKPEPRTQPE